MLVKPKIFSLFLPFLCKIAFFVFLFIFNPAPYAQEKNKDALTTWRNLVTQAIFSNTNLSRSESHGLSMLFDSYIATSIYVSEKRSFTQLLSDMEAGLVLDNKFLERIEKADNYLMVTAFEYKFHTIIASQNILNLLYHNLSTPGKLENIVLYSTTNYECTNIKSKLLYDLLSILQTLNKDDRRRCWLALERMMSAIDFNKAESGNKPVQATAYGMFIKPSEIVTFLTKCKDNESNDLKDTASKYIEILKINGNKRKTTPHEDENIVLEYGNEEKIKHAVYITDLLKKADSLNNASRKINIYSNIINSDSTIFAAYINRGLSYYNMNKYDSAFTDFKYALKLNPWSGLPDFYLGVLFHLRKDDDKALSSLNRAIELDPYLYPAYTYRGLVYQKRNQFNQAVNDFTAAIMLDSTSASNFINRGNCYASLKKFSYAEDDFNIAVKKSPFNPSIYYNLGSVYYIQNKFQMALTAWEKCRSLENGFRDVQDKLKMVRKKISGIN